MSVTRELANYLAEIEYDQLPTAVQERAKLAVLDSLGVALGGYGLPEYRDKFFALAKAVGGGISEATLVGDGAKVSLPLAAFANTRARHCSGLLRPRRHEVRHLIRMVRGARGSRSTRRR